VRSAVGFNQQRGDTVEVANLQFAAPPPVADPPAQGWFGFGNSDLIRLAEILALALVGVLVTLLVARPLVASLLVPAPAGAAAGPALPARQANPALPAPSGAVVPSEGGEPSDADQMIDISQVEGRVKASSIRKIGEIVEKHPEEAVSIVRNWMYQDS
jgi:flagellar M-ring protein FliF